MVYVRGKVITYPYIVTKPTNAGALWRVGATINDVGYLSACDGDML